MILIRPHKKGSLTEPTAMPSPKRKRLEVEPFQSATSCTASVHGVRGVLFLRWPSGRSIVLKALPDSQEAVASIFCRMLCGIAHVFHPNVEVLWMSTERGKHLIERVRALLAEQPSTSRDRGKSLEDCSAVLLMEHIHGVPLLPAEEAPTCAMARLELPGVAYQLGRIVAVDIVLNNRDRIPLGIPAWRSYGQETVRTPPHPGNPDNLLFRESDLTVVAIDTELKRGYPENTPAAWQPMPPITTDSDYLEQLKAILSGLRSISAAKGQVSDLACYVRDGLQRLRKGVVLSDRMLLTFQSGLIEAMDRMGEVDLQQLHASAMRLVGLREESLSAVLVRRAQRVLDVWHHHNSESSQPHS